MSDVTLTIIDPYKDDVLKLSCSTEFYGALLVMTGKYGIGSERAKALRADGFDAVKVQTVVNEIVGVI